MRDSSAPPAAFVSGLLALLAAAVASAALVAQAADLAALPGCGPTSACARAAASAWGRLPVLDWPTSHVGLAYFIGFGVTWIVTRGAPGARLRALARAGLLVSVLLCSVMLAERALCPYCLAVHAANLAFVVALELGSRGLGGAPLRGALPFGATFVGATALLFVADLRQQELRQADAEQALAEATDEIAERARRRAPREDILFTGRYRLGPETAAIRIVVFSDYQCPDCRRVENELQSVIARHASVSLAAKHFPFCSDCNEVARRLSYSPHPNACLAAQAAEAAGLLGGADAFWATHRWLFQHEGAFAEDELLAFVATIGLDPAAFRQVWHGPEVLSRIRADVAEGARLGLQSTPMLFLNGVELRGWTSPGAVVRAVDALVARDLPPDTARADRPPGAVDKHLDDWRTGPRRVIRTHPRVHWRSAGEQEARVDVVVWGDYEEAGTRELERELLRLLEDRGGVRHAFRHYPIDRSCNPQASRTLHPNACTAARAAEAAALLGGAEAFWGMHRHLIDTPDFDASKLDRAAAELGLDVDAFRSALWNSVVQDGIGEDAAEAKRLGLRGVPFLWVGGRRVPRWRLEGASLLERILDAALAE